VKHLAEAAVQKWIHAKNENHQNTTSVHFVSVCATFPRKQAAVFSSKKQKRKNDAHWV
jgi:hypothetical protein